MLAATKKIGAGKQFFQSEQIQCERIAAGTVEACLVYSPPDEN